VRIALSESSGIGSLPQNSVALENNSFAVGHFRYAKACGYAGTFPTDACRPSPKYGMAILSSMITAAGCYYSELLAPQETENFDEETAFIFAGRGPANSPSETMCRDPK